MYKVDADAISLKVREECATKGKIQSEKKAVAEVLSKGAKKAKAA